MIAGFDMGLRKTGVVLLNDQRELISQNLIRVRPSSKGAQRLCEIETAVDSILNPLEEEINIFIEGYAYGAKYQRESLAELGGVMRRYFYMHKLDYWVVPPTSIKYFVTGNGNASKNYMKKCTKDRWGISFKSDDICDAYGLSRLGQVVIEALTVDLKSIPLTAHEREVVYDIISYKDQYLNGNTAKRKGRIKKTNERR